MLKLEKATDQEAAAKVRQSVLELLIVSPLFGLTVLGTAIRVEEKLDIPTMCTDGRKIWYSPAWVHKKPLKSVMFDVLHENLHIFGNHPARRGNRDPKIWNYACDIRVAHDARRICQAKDPNWELDSDHAPAFAWAEHMSVEEIYAHLIAQQQHHDPIPRDYQPDMVDSNETPEEETEFKTKLTQDLAQASLAEEQLSKKPLKDVYGDSIWERLQELKRCDVPWHVLLQGRLCAALGQERATWVPPNRRWFPEIALPSRRGSQEDELLLGVDVSGSIDDDDIARFRACVMPAARRAKRTTIVTFDAVVREVISATRPEALLRNTRFTSGSHSYTDARGVFLEVDKRRPSAVAILTDGYITLPDKPYPHTHWILKPTTSRELPWGRHYKLRASW